MKISVLQSHFNKVDSKNIKEALTQVFSCEYCKELLRWLLLLFQKVCAEAQYIYIFNNYDRI